VWHDDVGRKVIIGGVPALVMLGVIALLPRLGGTLPEPATAVVQSAAKLEPTRAAEAEPVVPPVPEASLVEFNAHEPAPVLNRLPDPSDDDPQPSSVIVAQQEPSSYDVAPLPPKPVAKKRVTPRTAQRRSAKRRAPNLLVRVHRSLHGLLARVF
jgi:hypothetical protein